jgi:hypothetical protein
LFFFRAAAGFFFFGAAGLFLPVAAVRFLPVAAGRLLLDRTVGFFFFGADEPAAFLLVITLDSTAYRGLQVKIS